MGRNKSDIIGGIGAGFEILKALKDELTKLNVGDPDAYLRKIKSSASLRRKVAELLVGNTATAQAAAPVATVPVVHTVDLDADPYVPNGWSVEEHKKGGRFVWDKEKVKFYLSQKQQGGYIIGNDLRKELADKPVFNACLLDFLFAHPELIPEEWKGKAVFFWGTIYRDSDDRLCVRYLYWDDGRWDWNYYWLDSGWNSCSPAVVSAS